jgi:hypothetical protein
MNNGYRNESDLLGTLPVPADALYGIHTQRAIENFPLSGRPGEQAIADVRLGTNNIETVILGPASAIREQTQFAAGDQIAFWARPGTLDGLPVLVATQIDLGTRVLNITGTSVDSRSEDLLVPVE